MGQNKVVRKLNRELRKKYKEEGIEPTHKYCSVCNELKTLEEFCKCNDGIKLFGVDAKCKICNRKRNKEFMEIPKNKQHRDEYSRKYHAENKDIINPKRRKYKKDNEEKVKLQNKKSNTKNKDTIAERIRNKRRTNEPFRMRCLLGTRLWTVMNRKKNKPSKEYGIDWQECISYLGECPSHIISPSIDHIIPCKAFDFSNPEHPALCFHPTNLRWLEQIENETKQDKIYPYLIRSYNLEWICKEIGLDLDSYVEGELLRVKEKEV